MATIVTATCSECFMEQEIELNPRKGEIVCDMILHKQSVFLSGEGGVSFRRLLSLNEPCRENMLRQVDGLSRIDNLGLFLNLGRLEVNADASGHRLRIDAQSPGIRMDDHFHGVWDGSDQAHKASGVVVMAVTDDHGPEVVKADAEGFQVLHEYKAGLPAVHQEFPLEVVGGEADEEGKAMLGQQFRFFHHIVHQDGYIDFFNQGAS